MNPEDSIAPFSKLGTCGSPTDMPAFVGPPQRPGTAGMVEHYDLLSVLGEGGMAVVYLARDTRKGEKVALKLLKAKVAGSARAAAFFRKEVNHLARLSHPNIIRVLESSTEGQGEWFTTPYFPRGSLDKVIRAERPIGQDRVIELLSQVAEALAFAHARGIIHRDLKPRNVLIGDDGRAVLADFGLARSVLNDELLDPERPQVEGTVHYMSPQAVAGEQEDSRGDIYSLGALLYELLTGRVPYSDVPAAALVAAIKAGPPTPIKTLNPKASEGLVRIAEWAMARELRDRYAHIADLIADLKAVEAGQQPAGPHRSVLGTSTRAWWKTLSWQRSRRLIPACAMLVLLAAIAHWGLESPRELLKVGQWSLTQDRNFSALFPVVMQADRVPTFVLPEPDGPAMFSAQGRYLGRVPPAAKPPPTVCYPFSADTDDDGVDELFPSWTQGRQLTLAALRSQVWTKLEFHAEGADPHPKDAPGSAPSVLLPRAFLPRGFQADARTSPKPAKLLAYLHTNHSKRPRALCCYDFRTQHLDWQTLVGPSLGQPVLMDLDDDGINEVLIGSHAICNGNTTEDCGDDQHVYVFAFSSSGRLIWKTELRDRQGSAEVKTADLHGTGKPDILALVTPIETNVVDRPTYLSRIVQLDPKDGHILRGYEPRIRLISWLLQDLDGDGKAEIVATDNEGFLHVLGPNLTLQSMQRISPEYRRTSGYYDEVELRLRGTAKLVRGKPPYLIATSWELHNSEFHWGTNEERRDKSWREQEWIYVLDSRLRIVARFSVAKRSEISFAWSILITDLEQDGEDEILLLSDRVEILKLR